MPLRPLARNVIIQPVLRERSEGGILFTAPKEKRNNEAIVRAVGNEVPCYEDLHEDGSPAGIAPKVQNGQTILYTAVRAYGMHYKNSDYLIITDEDILAVEDPSYPEWADV